MSGKHYENEVGTIIDVDCGCDISTATSRSLIVLKPSGIEETWDANIQGTNYLRYVTKVDDFSEKGRYALQAKVALPGWSGLGETVYFEIYKKFE